MATLESVNFVHIDGDVIVYRAGFAAEVGYWRPIVGGRIGNLFATKSQAKAWAISDARHEGEISDSTPEWDVFYDPDPEPVENCLHSVKLIIGEIINELDLDFQQHAVHLSSPGPTFRHDLATIRPYKGTRDPSHQPYHKQAIRDYLEQRYNVIWSTPGLEADDEMAIRHRMAERPTCIATIDKDLDMIPGWHYDFVKKEKYHMGHEAAMRSFFTQMLTGDTADNIQGCPGIGKVRAEKIFDRPYNMEEYGSLVYNHYSKSKGYKDAGHDEVISAIKETASLLWILRSHSDTPPTPKAWKSTSEPSGEQDAQEVGETLSTGQEQQRHLPEGAGSIPEPSWEGSTRGPLPDRGRMK